MPQCPNAPCVRQLRRCVNAPTQTRALVFTPSGAWRGGRAAVIERLRGYHQPLNGLANASHRRMMMQCTDTPGSGLGSKLSYPDDTLSLERDSEKVPHVYCMGMPHVHSRRHVHTCMRVCMCKQTHRASYPSGRRARRPRTPTWRCSPSLPRRRASTCALSPSRASWRAPPALACSPMPRGLPPGRRSPRSTGGGRSRPAIPTAVEHH